MGDEANGEHLSWRACSGGGSRCDVCGIPVLPRAWARQLFENGDPVAVEAFAVVEDGNRATRWVCLVCFVPGEEQTVDTGDPAVRFHVTSPLNRASIAEHGLDWRRMRDAPGIAGTRLVPELDGIFLARSQWEARWFAGFKTPVDIWAVSLAGVELEDCPDGFEFTRSPIPSSRVRLIQADDSYRLEHRSIPLSEL